jgi:hypothetical protein
MLGQEFGAKESEAELHKFGATIFGIDLGRVDFKIIVGMLLKSITIVIFVKNYVRGM